MRKKIPFGQPLSNTEIMDFVNSIPELQNNVNQRVYQRNELFDKNIDWNKSVIINLQPSTQGNGTHWTVWLPNIAYGGGLYEMIQEYGQKIANLRKDPRKGLSLPGMNYCGPLNEVSEQYFRDYPPVNQTDSVCKKHDILYHRANELETQEERDKAYREADNNMLAQLKHVQPGSLGEKVQKWFVDKAIKGKTWIEDRIRGKGMIKDIEDVVDREEGIITINSKKEFNEMMRDYRQKNKNTSFYFDSYGFPPVDELTKILQDSTIAYQSDNYQKSGNSCGNYVLYVLYQYYVNRKSFYDIVDHLNTPNSNEIIRKFSTHL